MSQQILDNIHAAWEHKEMYVHSVLFCRLNNFVTCYGIEKYITLIILFYHHVALIER